MGTTIVANKIIGGFLAVLLILNMNLINFATSEIEVEINDYYSNNFYGNIIVEDEKYPIVIKLDGTTTINKKEDKKENINKKEDITTRDDRKESIDRKENINKREERINEKVINDKTPGKLVVKITKEGEFTFENDMGSGEKSEFDKECNKIVVDALVDYVKNDKGKKVPSKVKNFILGFGEYMKRDTVDKGFVRKIFPWI